MERARQMFDPDMDPLVVTGETRAFALFGPREHCC
jgi:hypothetical protein